MKRMWDQLQPTERRWVAVIGLILFIVLNWIFILPHFSDWKRADARITKAQTLMAQYQNEIKNEPTYQARITALQSDSGTVVDDDDQGLDFVRFYESRARSNDVQVINNSRPSVNTNDPFFVNHEMQLNVQGREAQMVNFLYSLSAGSSIVRVRALSLRPDASHQQINANISLVASYAKRAPARAAASTAQASAPVKAPAAPAAPGKAPANSAHTNKPIVDITHNNAKSNKPPVPVTAKRP